MDGVLCGETVTLGAMFKGDARAPGPEELADEYPYIGAAAKTLTVAKAYAQNVSAEAAQALNNALTQMEIFNRLTGNGVAQGLYIVDGQLYVNASYINAGEMSANRIRGGRYAVGGVNDTSGAIDIYDKDGNVIGVIDRKGVELRTDMQSSADLLRFTIPRPGGSRTVMLGIQVEHDSDENKTISRFYMSQNPDADETKMILNVGVGAAISLSVNNGLELDAGGSSRSLRLSGNPIINGTSCVSGTFTTANGKNVTVTKGLVTVIS